MIKVVWWKDSCDMGEEEYKNIEDVESDLLYRSAYDPDSGRYIEYEILNKENNDE